MELVYGTHNPAKIRSMREDLSGLDIKIIGLTELAGRLYIPDEAGNSPLENARAKAKAYYEQLKRPVFSCDSGLYFDGLADKFQPGVHIRRVNGNELDDECMIAYYSHLAAQHGGRLTAYYRNAICLVMGEAIIEYDGDDICSRRFLLLDKPHQHREAGFPLDCLSADIASGQYWYDIPERNMSGDQEGFRTFFQRLLVSI